MILQSTNYHTKCGIFFYYSKEMKSLAVPVDDWLRTQLTNIEKDIMMKVSIPSDVPKSKEGAYVYKPLSLSETLFVPVSKFCKYFKYDQTKHAHVCLESFEPFEKGHYNVNIEVSHVYIGPHKGGQNFSLSLRITQLTYKEEEAITSFSFDDEDIARVLGAKPIETTPQKKKDEKRARKSKTGGAVRSSKRD